MFLSKIPDWINSEYLILLQSFLNCSTFFCTYGFCSLFTYLKQKYRSLLLRELMAIVQNWSTASWGSSKENGFFSVAIRGKANIPFYQSCVVSKEFYFFLLNNKRQKSCSKLGPWSSFNVHVAVTANHVQQYGVWEAKMCCVWLLVGESVPAAS